jgi:NAD-dependent deacetylase
MFSQKLIQAIQEANHITALTGAGISAESGIPTFREEQTGLWSHYDPEELATPQAFRANPKLIWEWYRWRQEIIRQAEPNPGHTALAQIESLAQQHEFFFSLITQNVDGLHKRAGNHNIIELHGNINRSKCATCGIIGDDIPQNKTNIPRCNRCGGLQRPDVVWFGENLPAFALQASWEAAQICDIFLSIGTSVLVQPAASLPLIAKNKGATVIEINPNETPITSLADYRLQGCSGEILPQLVKVVWPEHK